MATHHQNEKNPLRCINKWHGNGRNFFATKLAAPEHFLCAVWYRKQEIIACLGPLVDLREANEVHKSYTQTNQNTHTRSAQGALRKVWFLQRQPVKCSYARTRLFKQTEVHKERSCSVAHTPPFSVCEREKETQRKEDQSLQIGRILSFVYMEKEIIEDESRCSVHTNSSS